MPFELTASQRKALDEIIRDFSETHPMNRLLQGDVGSGKTIVAGLTAIGAAGKGRQQRIEAGQFTEQTVLFGERLPFEGFRGEDLRVHFCEYTAGEISGNRA